MDTTSLFLVLIIGLVFWGSWPLVAQWSDISDPLTRGFLVNAVAALGFLPFMVGKISAIPITSSGFWILIVAGLFNFGGHALFPKLQTAAGSEASLYMALIPGLVVLASAIGGPLLHGETVTIAKTCFTTLIVIGIVGLACTSWR